MSALYNLEPPPTGKVLLTTTSGDILLELFAKQTPLASRNFLQHCLDGYYDNSIFHRLVPGFIIQGGDPTGTGHGGESVYERGESFEDEFHSRLKFNRRGLLGMANGGGKNDNGSQFFMTLAPTPELQGRHTLFGRVVGDTIFNLTKMGDAELDSVEGSERPLYPTKVTGAEVLVNPFEGMARREVKPKQRRELETSKPDRKKGKKKSGKGLLSFGNEEGEEEEEALPKQKFAAKSIKAENRNPGEKKSTRKPASRSPSPPRLSKPSPQSQLPLPKNEVPPRSPSTSPEPAPAEKMTTLLDKTNAQIAELKASMKRNITSTPATDNHKKSALEQMMPQNAVRGRKRKLGNKENAELETLDMFNAFRTRLEKAVPESKMTRPPPRNDIHESAVNGQGEERLSKSNGDEAELCDLHFVANCQSCKSWDAQQSGEADADEDNDTSWMSHALTFEKDRLGKDLTWKRKNEEELVVIDPREKAKDIREEQRAKKIARIGGRAGHVTEWSKDRDKGREPQAVAAQGGR